MLWTERALGLCAARQVDLQMSIAELFLFEMQDPGFLLLLLLHRPR